MMETFLQDVRYAFRSLARTPVLAVAAVLTLGLGIGANSAMFGVVDRLFFRPPAHVVDPGRVGRLYVRHHAEFANSSGSGEGEMVGPVSAYPSYLDLRDHARSLSAVAAYTLTTLTVGIGADAGQATAGLVTPSYFPLLGVRPELGRFPAADEDRNRVVVLSDAYWRVRFRADAGILGRRLQVGRNPYTVIGVAPSGFTGLDVGGPDLWVPLASIADEVMFPGVLDCGGCGWLGTVARLAPGVTPIQAGAEATAIFRGSRHPNAGDPSTAVVTIGSVHDALGPTAGSNVRLSMWFAAVCGIVLLIACANVANLLLVRSVQRRREIAVRLALGVSRGRLARQLMAEAAVLAILGGVAALVVMLWLEPVLRATLLPEAEGPVLDLRVLAYSAAVVLTTIVLAGLAPAVQSTRPDLSEALKTGAREGTAPRSRLRSALLAGQVALALVLLAGAGLFVSSLRNLQHRPLGFDADHVIAVSAQFQAAGYPPAEQNAAYEQLRQRLLALPGIRGASLSVGSPFGPGFGVGLAVPGLDSLPKTGIRFFQAVGPDYFRVLGTTIRRGRGFTDADEAAAPRVAVVNEAMAHDLWPGDDPLGKCLEIGRRPAPCFTVVGVAENSVRSGLRERPVMQYFAPRAQTAGAVLSPVTTLLLRTAGPPAALTQAVQRAARAALPVFATPTVDPFPMEVAKQLAPWRRGALLLGFCAGLGVLLAAIGLYGVLSYMVSQRTQELGVRVALGAARRDLLALVVGQGLRVTAVGVVVGAAGALIAGKALASLLYGVSAHDPVVLGVVAGLVLLVALLASYLPALRATRVDPMVALRYE